jgi:hypothetical protein
MIQYYLLSHTRLSDPTWCILQYGARFSETLAIAHVAEGAAHEGV